MDPTAIASLFERFNDYLTAAGFAVARVTGVIVIMPAFTRLGLNGILRGAVALALALPMVPALVPALAGQRLSVLTIAVLLLKETTVGVIIGLVLGVPFWAAEAAGDVLDLQRGSRMANLIDPSAMTSEGITSTLFGLAMVALYYVVGGLELTLRTIYDSYGLWPAGRFVPSFNAAASQLFLGLLDNVITTGLLLGAPLVVCLLLADLLLALVARASPHLNVFALTLSVKNFVFALLLTLYCTFLIYYMGTDLRSLVVADRQLAPLAAQPARR